MTRSGQILVEVCTVGWNYKFQIALLPKKGNREINPLGQLTMI
jgi:hypothetical protein